MHHEGSKNGKDGGIAKANQGRDLPCTEANAAAERLVAEIANAFADGSSSSTPVADRYMPDPPAECGLCRTVKRNEPVSNTEHGPLCGACEEAITDGWWRGPSAGRDSGYTGPAESS